MLTKLSLLFCVSLLLVCTAHAQGGRPAPQGKPTGSRSSTLQVELPTPVAETPVPLVGGGGGQMQTLSFVTPDTNFDESLVKGAPFSAESTTEHVQLLGDGNRMVRKSSAKLYRDAAGRTRREHEITRGRGAAPDGHPARLIVINNPLTQVNFIIETHNNIARKRHMPPPNVREAMQRARGDSVGFGVLMPTSAVRRREAEGDAAPAPPKPVREKLGSQIVEGVAAEGTRTTLTIPAGEFDNELPIVISHEEWYAPELQMIVLMKHNDPRFGETTFRLTNILRGEPAPELFQLPDGITVVDAGRGDMPRPFRRPVGNP
ncbi:MAG TPA: hypothetical protein VJU84_06075 [Pyrinomonadaceae bacterium]|nr:hypothetical protein [Pyrinomonadaceae bacterium]